MAQSYVHSVRKDYSYLSSHMMDPLIEGTKGKKASQNSGFHERKETTKSIYAIYELPPFLRMCGFSESD